MLTVMKFGGSSVADLEHIRNVANRCIAKQREGSQVVVVLSAMGKTTDNLIATAKQITEQPSRRELDMLLTTGEQVSVSLMAMTLISMGVSAVSLNAWQVPMHTTSNYQNARFKRIDSERIRKELDANKIVIVTGFQGVNKYDDITTLGRGGSDTSAVALAAALNAERCDIYTDVEGVYTTDPRIVPKATRLAPFRAYPPSPPLFARKSVAPSRTPRERPNVSEASTILASISTCRTATSKLDSNNRTSSSLPGVSVTNN